MEHHLPAQCLIEQELVVRDTPVTHYVHKLLIETPVYCLAPSTISPGAAA